MPPQRFSPRRRNVVMRFMTTLVMIVWALWGCSTSLLTGDKGSKKESGDGEGGETGPTVGDDELDISDAVPISLIDPDALATATSGLEGLPPPGEQSEAKPCTEDDTLAPERAARASAERSRAAVDAVKAALAADGPFGPVAPRLKKGTTRLLKVNKGPYRFARLVRRESGGPEFGIELANADGAVILAIDIAPGATKADTSFAVRSLDVDVAYAKAGEPVEARFAIDDALYTVRHAPKAAGGVASFNGGCVVFGAEAGLAFRAAVVLDGTDAQAGLQETTVLPGGTPRQLYAATLKGKRSFSKEPDATLQAAYAPVSPVFAAAETPGLDELVAPRAGRGTITADERTKAKPVQSLEVDTTPNATPAGPAPDTPFGIPDCRFDRSAPSILDAVGKENKIALSIHELVKDQGKEYVRQLDDKSILSEMQRTAVRPVASVAVSSPGERALCGFGEGVAATSNGVLLVYELTFRPSRDGTWKFRANTDGYVLVKINGAIYAELDKDGATFEVNFDKAETRTLQFRYANFFQGEPRRPRFSISVQAPSVTGPLPPEPLNSTSSNFTLEAAALN